MNNQNNQIYRSNGLDDQQNNNNNNNNDIHDFGSLGAAPLALGALNNNNGGGMVWKGSSNAPTMVDAFGLSDIAGPQPMAMSKQSQTMVHQQAIMIPQGGSSSGSPAFADLDQVTLGDMKPKLMVLPNVNDGMNESMDFSEFKSEPMFFVPSKCIGLNGGGLQPTPAMYNEMTSIVVDETPKQVLSKFQAILSTFSNDIDFSIDEQNYIINGQIFIRHFAVFFKISIWNEQNEQSDRTRFEFRRSKGDTVGFTEFWNEIEDILYQQFTNAKGQKNMFDDEDESVDMDLDSNNQMGFGGLPPLDYNFNLDLDLDSASNNDQENTLKESLTSKDLDNFVYDLDECDPSVVYSIAMLLDAFKLQTSFLQMVLNHSQFIKCIIESALNHQDTALVRGALLTLESLCDSKSGADHLMAFNVLDAVTPLLQHQCDLIRKYTVRVLSKLSSAQSWNFQNDKLRKFAQIKVNECQSKWQNCRFATNDFIQQQMFENIHQKLVKV